MQDADAAYDSTKQFAKLDTDLRCTALLASQ